MDLIGRATPLKIARPRMPPEGPDKSLELQMQIRRNAMEMQEVFSDLFEWEKDIAKKVSVMRSVRADYGDACPRISRRGILSSNARSCLPLACLDCSKSGA